ncbi:MAG: alpha/beta fold hydrolase [Pseudorhodoplanes sp.]|uniref:alpha/beta fold hydrolase n=1 Tax=Pseudorhodoplanes sp. TaxID=1934341 RepID=UPI003D0C977E
MSATLSYGGHVHANGIRQHYLRFGGEGAPLIVIPGIISPAILWTDVGERLGRELDAFILDVRGRGLSECGEHLDYGLDACAADLCAFADALKLRNATVVGHSNGARIAIRAARREDAQFARIILIDPPVSGPGRRPYPSPLQPLLKCIEAARRGEGWEALLESPLAQWPERLQRLRAEWLHTCDPRAVTVTHNGFHSDDIHCDLQQMAVPTSIIAAGKGGVVLDEDEREILGLNPEITFQRVANAGHQVQVDDFDGLFLALSEVLDIKL